MMVFNSIDHLYKSVGIGSKGILEIKNYKILEDVVEVTDLAGNLQIVDKNKFKLSLKYIDVLDKPFDCDQISKAYLNIWLEDDYAYARDEETGYKINVKLNDNTNLDELYEMLDSIYNEYATCIVNDRTELFFYGIGINPNIHRLFSDNE